MKLDKCFQFFLKRPKSSFVFNVGRIRISFRILRLTLDISKKKYSHFVYDIRKSRMFFRDDRKIDISSSQILVFFSIKLFPTLFETKLGCIRQKLFHLRELRGRRSANNAFSANICTRYFRLVKVQSSSNFV